MSKYRKKKTFMQHKIRSKIKNFQSSGYNADRTLPCYSEKKNRKNKDPDLLSLTIGSPSLMRIPTNQREKDINIKKRVTTVTLNRWKMRNK